MCPKCWDITASEDWDVLSETRAISAGEKKRERGPVAGDKAVAIAVAQEDLPRALQLRAMPNEDELLHFLMASFSAEKHSAGTPEAPSVRVTGASIGMVEEVASS